MTNLTQSVPRALSLSLSLSLPLSLSLYIYIYIYIYRERERERERERGGAVRQTERERERERDQTPEPSTSHRLTIYDCRDNVTINVRCRQRRVDNKPCLWYDSVSVFTEHLLSMSRTGLLTKRHTTRQHIEDVAGGALSEADVIL